MNAGKNKYNAKKQVFGGLFIVWIHGMHSQFRRNNEGVGGCPYDEQTEKKFLEFIRSKKWQQ